ncbi:uncharacterized protein ASCRUDRAFT_76237 [Ascoidea rubescens DSM 1968]|uniref:Uncharacterized protein n=1 Tax=Ascoidea rubescens DSM 1968 TaxID=1344418 RepID=A0A1D2VH40_9ASCO|nr:hypothetical protein ASCRUDRAFT_76228 [Ascoidea rubescens DSM 1968]XP_020047188.1 hypothetical protein ASCRUDRAFT_76237 [Ascoidea rubescens DSM 1968]ODV60870.1 hypothetical protein ASCRUDRAFT_76228 [Ascoidea rubescens DSM 1968]ODV60881.1 hypothetical protein ASCRUDRAFT_76237 [Ascoidea rubescens DSM 1968]
MSFILLFLFIVFSFSLHSISSSVESIYLQVEAPSVPEIDEKGIRTGDDRLLVTNDPEQLYYNTEANQITLPFREEDTPMARIQATATFTSSVSDMKSQNFSFDEDGYLLNNGSSSFYACYDHGKSSNYTIELENTDDDCVEIKIYKRDSSSNSTILSIIETISSSSTRSLSTTLSSTTLSSTISSSTSSSSSVIPTDSSSSTNDETSLWSNRAVKVGVSDGSLVRVLYSLFL